MTTLKSFRKATGLPNSVRRWSQVVSIVRETTTPEPKPEAKAKHKPKAKLVQVRAVHKSCGGKSYTPLSNFYAMLDMAKYVVVGSLQQELTAANATEVIAKSKERPDTWYFTFDEWLVWSYFRNTKIGPPSLLKTSEEPPDEVVAHHKKLYGGPVCKKCKGDGVLFNKTTYRTSFCTTCKGNGLAKA